METFWGISAEGWTAIGTWVLAAITAFLVGGGLYQVSAIRHENKKGATLAACTAYESNFVLYDAIQKLWQARESRDLYEHPRRYRPQLIILLNYLDGIAIGIDQGLYIEDLAWDHMQGIVTVHTRDYIDSGIIIEAGLFREDFRCLLCLRDKWQQARPRFTEKRSWFWRF